MKHIIFLSLAICLAFTACKKSEIEQIPNNNPPTDGTISSVTIDNYITRTYILTLGREPDNVEFSTARSLLTSATLDSSSRRAFLSGVFNSNDYRAHVYNENKIQLLNNADTADFTFWIYIFQLFLVDTTYRLQWPYYQYEADRMIELKSAFTDYTTEAIEIDVLHSRMCNNYLYDEINMGSANFVISTFQNLIDRNPTVSEQQSGVSMVEGSNAVLFLESGSSKNDYLNIFTHSRSYYEGQVILLYKKYLNRIPNTVEMAEGTEKYSSTLDYTAVQRDILSSDEFIGL